MNNSFAAANIITFYYACDHEGNYKPLQYYGVKGIQWCVNPITGHISEGKKAPTGQHLDCSAENKLKILLIKLQVRHLVKYHQLNLHQNLQSRRINVSLVKLL